MKTRNTDVCIEIYNKITYIYIYIWGKQTISPTWNKAPFRGVPCTNYLLIWGNVMWLYYHSPICMYACTHGCMYGCVHVYEVKHLQMVRCKIPYNSWPRDWISLSLSLSISLSFRTCTNINMTHTKKPLSTQVANASLFINHIFLLGSQHGVDPASRTSTKQVNAQTSSVDSLNNCWNTLW